MNAIQQATQGKMELRFGKGKKFTIVPVETLNQASAIWCRFIEQGNYGASDGYQAWIFVDGTRRGKLSYNGKAFSNGGELIYNPYEATA